MREFRRVDSSTRPHFFENPKRNSGRASSLYSASTTLRRPLPPQHEKPVVAKVRKPESRFLSQHSINSFSSKLLQACGTRLTTDPSRMSSTKKPTGKTQRSAIADVVAREYTIHLHKRVKKPKIVEIWRIADGRTSCMA